MMFTIRLNALVMVVAASMAAAGCSGSASLSPAAPSGASAGSGAVISGHVNSSASLASVAPPSSTLSATTAATTGGALTVTVVGSNVSTAVDTGGTFTLTNVPPGTVELRFSGRGMDATLTISGVSDQDRIQIAVTLNGSQARLDSKEHVGANRRVEVEGRITAVDAGAKTIRVGDTLVVVPAAAVIRHGSMTMLFADLAIGDHVEVKGTRDGSTVTASEVEVEQGGDDDADDDEAGHDLFHISGPITGLAGTCPTVTFTLKGTKVTTSASTLFDGGCSALKNDMLVEVKGSKGSDGTVAAAKVERD